MAERAKHAFGMLENIDTALSDGIIDSYDILFVKDANGKPYVGWIDKEGNKVVCDDAEEFAELEAKIAAVGKDYEISHKPNGTLVDYRDKEIRVMCPADTKWTLQNSGEGADKNKHYIGFKAYAPGDAVSFKEDLAEIIADDTMYSFEGNDFAGVDAQGRKYSIVWLPAAVYDEGSGTWTYYGANSSKEKYIGWYYSVEWYNADGVIISSDCIRINLSNESCYSVATPYYVGVIEKKFEEKIAKIETKVEENSSYEIVEF